MGCSPEKLKDLILSEAYCTCPVNEIKQTVSKELERFI